MCLAIPMEIVSIDGLAAVCSARGVQRTVSLFLMQGETFAKGDILLIHLDSAVGKISREEALATWQLYDQMQALAQDARAAGGTSSLAS